MAIRLPLRQLASDTFSLTIEETAYQIRTRWNTREERWRLDLFEQDETPILRGLKILPLVPLTRRYIDKRLPQLGDIYVVDVLPITDTTPFSFEDLDNRLQVWYVTNEEIDAILQGV